MYNKFYFFKSSKISVRPYRQFPHTSYPNGCFFQKFIHVQFNEILEMAKKQTYTSSKCW